MKKGLFDKIRGFFGIGQEKEEFFENIEDVLIEGDMGYKTAADVTDRLRVRAKEGRLKQPEDLRHALKEIIGAMLRVDTLVLEPGKRHLFLILGVNGVGKTTSLAKLARYFQLQGQPKTLLCAGDTFRAAATEQLQLHGKRLGLRVVAQGTGADPGAVLYDALDSAATQGETLVLADTAGRLHNKVQLIKELQKVDKIARGKMEGQIYKKILVLDATTGQNGLKQAEVFHEAVGVDGIILTKYDSTGRGGMAPTISSLLGIPFLFMGTGEKLEDLKVFDSQEFLENLLGGS